MERSRPWQGRGQGRQSAERALAPGGPTPDDDLTDNEFYRSAALDGFTPVSPSSKWTRLCKLAGAPHQTPSTVATTLA